MGLAGLAPELVAARTRPWLGEYDVAMRYVDGDRLGAAYLGNQKDVFGPAPADVVANRRFPKLSAEEMLVRVYRVAAAMHAAHWCDASLVRRESWLKHAPWYAGRQRYVWEGAVANVRDTWERVRRSRGEVWRELGDGLTDRIEASLRATSWDAYQRHLRNPAVPFTLCHGDFYAGNIVVCGADAGEVGFAVDERGPRFALVDWSEVGVSEPFHDLGQLLISDVAPDAARALLPALVRAYHAELLARRPDAAVQVPTPEHVLRATLRAGAERWIMLLVLCAGIRYLPDAAIAFWGRNLREWIAHADAELGAGGAGPLPLKTMVVLAGEVV